MKMSVLKYLKAACIAVCINAVSLPVFAEVVVIVNASNSLSSISTSDLGRLFLGKSQTFPDGNKAVPVNQIMASSSRTEFDEKMLNRSPSQMKGYWSRQLFSGEGVPPEEVNGDIDVLQAIAGNSAAIGYIDSAALNDAVKVLDVTD